MKTFLSVLIVMLTIINSYTQETRSASEAKGLKAGDKAPVFRALDADSNTFNFETALKNGPVVLIFYRGYWCPYCNEQLKNVQDSLKFISDAGASVIAISPEKPLYLNKMVEKTGAKFTLLYDEGYKISDAYDVTYTPEPLQLVKYSIINANLKKTHSDDSQRLPIPATYIISKEGKITWVHFDPDYKKRPSIKIIVDNLP